MVHTFTWMTKDDDDRCEQTGWVLDRKPYFDPSSGLGVAHDVLEEAPHGGEQPHDECMAMGAFIWGRGELWTHNNKWVTVPQSVASVLDMAFSHVYDESGYHFVAAPRTRPLSDYVFCERVESDIRASAEYFVTSTIASKLSAGELNEEHAEELLGCRDDIAHWMRIGARKARARFYPYLDGYDVAALFERLQNEVDKLHPEEGDRLSIMVRPSRYDYRLKHTEGWRLRNW